MYRITSQITYRPEDLPRQKEWVKKALDGIPVSFLKDIPTTICINNRSYIAVDGGSWDMIHPQLYIAARYDHASSARPDWWIAAVMAIANVWGVAGDPEIQERLQIAVAKHVAEAWRNVQTALAVGEAGQPIPKIAICDNDVVGLTNGVWRRMNGETVEGVEAEGSPWVIFELPPVVAEA